MHIHSPGLAVSVWNQPLSCSSDSQDARLEDDTHNNIIVLPSHSQKVNHCYNIHRRTLTIRRNACIQHNMYCEGRPINKLQNGIILLISKYKKSEI